MEAKFLNLYTTEKSIMTLSCTIKPKKKLKHFVVPTQVYGPWFWTKHTWIFCKILLEYFVFLEK